MIDERTSRSKSYRRRGCPWGTVTGWSRPQPWWENQSGAQEQAENPVASDLRVSDAERNVVVDELSEHLQAGRLDMDEFQVRTERALSARTRRDLAGLLTDLPPIEQPARQSRPHPWALVAVGLAIVGVLTAISLVVMAPRGFWFPWWLIPIGFFLTRRFWRRGWSTRWGGG